MTMEEAAVELMHRAESCLWCHARPLSRQHSDVVVMPSPSMSHLSLKAGPAQGTLLSRINVPLTGVAVVMTTMSADL